MPTSLRWDIFCRVVDNFGDAGVCWRLARQLAREHGLAVTLWIDDVASLARFAPALDADKDDQPHSGVRVRALDAAAARRRRRPPTSSSTASDAACPNATSPRWRRPRQPPVWVVLEYLSAEPWIDASHGAAVAASAAPADPLVLVSRLHAEDRRRAARSGAARERAMPSARDAAAARRRVARSRLRAGGRGVVRLAVLLCQSGVARAARRLGRRRRARSPASCPRASRSSELDRWTGGAVPHLGAPLTRGRLTIAVAPFVDQEAFDRRLWAADLNFVRGEDSFVRGAMGGAALRVAPLPAGRRRAPDQDGCVSHPARERAARGHADRRSARSGTRGTSATRTRPPKRGPPTARRCRRSPFWRGPGRAHWPGSTDLAERLVKFCESRL